MFWATGIHPFNSPLPFAQNGNFSLEQNDKRDLKIRKARCTLTSLSLRSARLTQYIWLAPAVARPIFASAIATANIRYTETLCDIFFNIFSQIEILLKNLKKEWNFYFFIFMRGISGYFLLHSSQKMII